VIEIPPREQCRALGGSDESLPTGRADLDRSILKRAEQSELGPPVRIAEILPNRIAFLEKDDRFRVGGLLQRAHAGVEPRRCRWRNGNTGIGRRDQKQRPALAHIILQSLGGGSVLRPVFQVKTTASGLFARLVVNWSAVVKTASMPERSEVPPGEMA